MAIGFRLPRFLSIMRNQNFSPVRRTRNYLSIRRLQTKDGSSKPVDANHSYIITTQTYGSKEASARQYLNHDEMMSMNYPTVSIQLVGVPFGSKNDVMESTEFLNLSIASDCKTFKETTKNVGYPKFIRLKFDSELGLENWFCDFIKIGFSNESEAIIYPLYDYLKEEMTIMEGKASLPQVAAYSEIQSARKAEVKRNKDVYKWIPKPSSETDLGWGLPRHVNATSSKNVPLMFRRDYPRSRSFLLAAIRAQFFKVSNCSDLRSLDAYKSVYEEEELPSDNKQYIDNWKSDKTMGRQVLTGISPLVINPCTSIKSLPDYFNVTDGDVSGLLEEGKSLEDEIEAGKIFIADYKPLVNGVERNRQNKNKEFYCSESIGLFYVKKDDFIPIAIQLVPEDRNYLFTANDSHEAWLLAKMYFRNSMTCIHEWVYHLLYTHIIMETFAVALFRCFPKCHPLYKLLNIHLWTVSAINTDARDSLLREGSDANQAMSLSGVDTARKFFKKFEFDDIVIPKVFAKKGMDKIGKDKLPGYYYRDDSMALWQIMEKFVTNVIGYYYKSDEDVLNDFELQNWIEDLEENGINWQQIVPNGVPAVKTVKQLIEVCVTLMFTSSAQHAAVNFGQFETYKFIPNSPVCMREPPLKRTEEITEASILKRLPNRDQATKAVAFTYMLSKKAEKEVYINQKVADNLFTEKEIIKMQEEYSKALEEFEAQLEARNKNLPEESQYTFLIPSCVPRSIAI